MRVAYNEMALKNFLHIAAKVSRDQPVVISKFFEKSKEVEVDGVYDGETCLIGSIMEHVENAGVHSGDATMSIPPQTLSFEVQKKIEDCTHRIVKALKILGPYNIQYLVKDGVVHVIECNLRASRSMPFVSKTRGLNLIELATLAMLDKKFSVALLTCQLPPIRHVGVKVPQFSFMRLSGADPVLGVEMLSTGEVACLGENFADVEAGTGGTSKGPVGITTYTPKGLELYLMLRLANILNIPNIATPGNICHMPRETASTLTCGFFPIPDYSGFPACVIVWGSNLFQTNEEGIIGYQLKQAIDQGTKLIVVDGTYMEMREVMVKRNPDCPECGDRR
jgi:hypothetical protein